MSLSWGSEYDRATELAEYTEPKRIPASVSWPIALAVGALVWAFGIRLALRWLR